MTPALAAEAANAVPVSVILPWGDWLVAMSQFALQSFAALVIPILAAAIIKYLRQTAPWIGLVLSQERVETMIQNACDFGVNSIAGAAKGKQLSIPVGIDVIAKGVQYVIDNAPEKVLVAAGGAEGIAQRIFRKLHLDDAANVDNVLAPAIERIMAGRR